MKPWVNTDKSKLSSVGAALTTRVLGTCFWGDCAAPLGLNKCLSISNPGLAPWAMQEYRPKGLLYVYPIIIILDYFDALALLLFSRNLEKYIIFVTNKSTSLRDGSRSYGCSSGGIFIL